MTITSWFNVFFCHINGCSISEIVHFPRVVYHEREQVGIKPKFKNYFMIGVLLPTTSFVFVFDDI